MITGRHEISSTRLICKQCGVKFIGIRRTRMYCSSRCAGKSNRKNMKDKQTFGENNEIGYVLGSIGIVALYIIFAIVVVWGLIKLF